MLTHEGCAARRARLWQVLPAPCDVLILGDPKHLIYFANYAPSPFVWRSVDATALLLLEPDRATVVADNLVQPFFDRAQVDEVVAPIWYEMKRSAPHRQGAPVRSALDRLAGRSTRRIGVEMATVPAGLVEGLRASSPGLEIVDLDPIIRPLRRAKDPDELDVIRRAIRAGEAGHAAALSQVVPGMTELDAYLIVQEAAIRAAGEPVLVYGDFASGSRTERERGGPPTSRPIERGDLLILDFSIIVNGYRGDFTNTLAVGNAPTPRQRALFEACVAALAAGEAELRPGNPARAVDAAVRGHFAALGLADAFPTHSGHGLGLGHPEPPYFVPESDDTIQAGDVVALEPGLYIEGVGGMRFERNYLITPDGFETLSRHRSTLDS
ncbi:MAG TPA: Xaa-Pro peptidase family protein [Isosphaeraceae bacterium]|nr:Xaa-Pro peptidase family protein [Isosphaeraceae bacterium]